MKPRADAHGARSLCQDCHCRGFPRDALPSQTGKAPSPWPARGRPTSGRCCFTPERESFCFKYLGLSIC